MFHNSIYDIEWKYYDLLYGNYSEDVKFYKKIIKNGNVLELMCGTGRISAKLPEKLEKWCLDSDYRMLNIASEKNKDIKCVKADVRDFHINRKFDYILIPLNSILLFQNKEKEKILTLSKEHIKENGKIIIDMIPPPDFEESMVYLGDHKVSDDLEIWRFFIPNYSDDMIILNLTYFYDIFEKGNYRRESAILTLYLENLFSMSEIIKNSGLRTIELYGDYNNSKYDPAESERMIFVLERE